MMKTTREKTDLIRLSRATGFQCEAILRLQKLGVLNHDLDLVSYDDPFIVSLRKIWLSRHLIIAEIDTLSDYRKNLLLPQEEEIPEQWEEDALWVFEELYRAGAKDISIDAMFNEIQLYEHERTPRVRKRASQLRRVAASRVRREKRRI